MSKNKAIAVYPFVSHEIIARKIYFIRGKKVMLDRDLAELYVVLTKALNQAVKRNLERFPEDFMFQLTKEEAKNWKSPDRDFQFQKDQDGPKKKTFCLHRPWDFHAFERLEQQNCHPCKHTNYEDLQ